MLAVLSSKKFRGFILNLCFLCDIVFHIECAVQKHTMIKNLFLYFLFFFFSKDGSCNGLQHYAALGRDKVNSFCSR
jgi:DNA-directed RNA polymerase